MGYKGGHVIEAGVKGNVKGLAWLVRFVDNLKAMAKNVVYFLKGCFLPNFPNVHEKIQVWKNL